MIAAIAQLLLADSDRPGDRSRVALALIVRCGVILAAGVFISGSSPTCSRSHAIGCRRSRPRPGRTTPEAVRIFRGRRRPDRRGDRLFQGVADGDVVGVAALIGLASLGLILVLQRTMPKVPAVLIVVVLAIVAVEAFDLVEHGVAVVGSLPQGFPPLTIPDVSLTDIAQLLPGALGIALVALVDTISTASAFAERAGDRIRGDQEMIGIGSANVAAGLFQGFPVSTSGSRTAVAEQAGAKTQVAGLVGAIAITLILLLVPGLLRNLPQPTLAAVVIAASLSLVDIPGVERLWRQRRAELPSRSRRSWASPCWGSCRASSSRSCCRSTTCSAGRGGPTRRPWDGSTVSRACTTRSSTPRRRSCRDSSSSGSMPR
jgi:hypothetical protein